MQVEQLRGPAGQVVDGPLLLTPQLFGDGRGFFFESWNGRRWQELLEAHGQSPVPFVQDNHSRSARGVLRGLHWQLPPHPQAKLLRCVEGAIFDVAVDIRHRSPTFGQWVGAELSAANHQQLWVPVGFAHGFLTLSEHAAVLYKTTDFWSRSSERALRWDDPRVAIEWPLLAEGAVPLLSEKDAAAPHLEQLGADELFS
ncbi:MAG: dTDP-4-dehydrorhamnose 3,5-epimerase [Cyanobacteriota bacterium]|nr:dTDP-4-dehydrorhamnose 3,5-epimerase [Cyanobacteriota bacterium]